MHSARLTVFTAILIAAAAVSISAANFETLEDEPDVSDRVARISSLKGDVSIRRAGMDDWEKAVLNLPVAEGDEITTADGARFEIQFNANSYVRVAPNSYLKITTLNDGGIALSLAEGSLSATAKKFDAAKSYLEIDAPKTTVAVQRSGRYRIDAGKPGSQEVRVSVFDDGEARVYSNNAGFTIRDGRSAKIFVEGSLAGEWENSFASTTIDDFDEWVAERDTEIQRRLSKANYGQFYDDDIYGAEELSDNGDWTYTRDYGYIWRPYQRSLVSYSDWSPYRYGLWRWLPSYGWTWVNDEPWGWATYHHGRWIWYNGGWYWSPYGYYRNRRSWWSPALVVFNIYNNNVCWYPLPYHRRHHNYNRHFNTGRNGRPGNTATATTVQPYPITQGTGEVPDVGVVAVPLEDFGKRRVPATRLPSQVARGIIAKEPASDDELKRLPAMRDIKTKVGGEIRAATPPWSPTDVSTRTGAEKRDKAEPLDGRLRNKIIYGDRPVVATPGYVPDTRTRSSDRKIIPSTGAVARPAPQKVEPEQPEPTQSPQTQRTPPWQERQQRSTPAAEPQKERSTPPVVKETPRSEPPRQRDTPPIRTEQPRSEPPKTREPSPQKSEPRSEPKSEPKSEPTHKSDPPPSKSESKSEPSRSDKKPNR